MRSSWSKRLGVGIAGACQPNGYDINLMWLGTICQCGGDSMQAAAIAIKSATRSAHPPWHVVGLVLGRPVKLKAGFDPCRHVRYVVHFQQDLAEHFYPG
jgi:hypothetical protein